MTSDLILESLSEKKARRLGDGRGHTTCWAVGCVLWVVTVCVALLYMYVTLFAESGYTMQLKPKHENKFRSTHATHCTMGRFQCEV